MKKLIILIIIFTFLISFPLLADNLDRLDAGGQRIVGIVQRIGYWIILIKCVADLIKSGINGDTHSIGRIVMSYVLIYGALFFVPWALRLVEGIFQ